MECWVSHLNIYSVGVSKREHGEDKFSEPWQEAGFGRISNQAASPISIPTSSIQPPLIDQAFVIPLRLSLSNIVLPRKSCLP